MKESAGRIAAIEPMGRFLPSPLVRSALHGDRTILLDLRRERYFGLDEVSTRIWALLMEGVDVPGIVARLGEEYDAPRERLDEDVTEILRRLVGLGVIVPARGQQIGEREGPSPRSLDSLAPRGSLRAPSGLRCALVLVGATLALRVLGLRRSLVLARQLSWRAPAAESPTPKFLAGVVRKVDTAAAFFPGRAMCLEQSLALYLCLHRAGVAVDFRIGVQPYPFTAHAWVEYRGAPVGESQDRVGKFVAFSDLEVF
jgi:hypothetical protein